MQTLAAISILCFFAICLAAVAIVKRVRSSSKRIGTAPHPPSDFAQHLISALEGSAIEVSAIKGRNIDPSRSVPQQTVKQVMAAKSWNQPQESVTVGPVNSRDQAPSPHRF